MSNASQRNFAAAQAQRDKRRLSLAEGEDPFVNAQQDYLGPGWDAFYGALDQKQQEAAAAGQNFRADLGGLGRAGYDGALGGLNPLDAQSAKYQAQNAASNAMTQRVQAQNQAQDDQATQDQQRLINDMGTSYINHVLGSMTPPSAAPVVTQTTDARGNPAYALRPNPSETLAQRTLSIAPGQMQPELQQNAEKDAMERQKTAAANPFGIGPGAGSGVLPPNAATAAARVPASAAGQPAPAAGLDAHGEDFIKTLPPGLAAQVKSYAEGRQAFPSGMALKTPYFQQMLQAVGQYDPSFDTTNFNARNQLRKDLTSTSGTGGKQIGALNTALQHVGLLSDAVERLDNSNFTPLNYIENPLGKVFGSTKATNFDVIQPQALKEIERLWRGSGGSQADIEDLKKSLGENMGIQQQREALANFAELVSGKLATLQDQRDKGLGPNAAKDIPIIYDRNRPVMGKVFQRSGTEPSDSTAQTLLGSQAAPDRSGGTVKLQAPDGSVRDVPANQADHYLSKGAKRIQ